MLTDIAATYGLAYWQLFLTAGLGFAVATVATGLAMTLYHAWLMRHPDPDRRYDPGHVADLADLELIDVRLPETTRTTLPEVREEVATR